MDREEVVHIHPTDTAELKLKLFNQVSDLLLQQADVPISSFLQIAQQISEIRNESELAQIQSFPVNDQGQMNEMVRSMYNLYVRLQQEQQQNVVAGIGQNRTPLDELKFIIQAAKEKNDEKGIGSRFESKRGTKRVTKHRRQQRQHEKKMLALDFLKKVMSKTMKRHHKKICQINDPHLIVKTAKKKLMNIHKKCKSRRTSRKHKRSRRKSRPKQRSRRKSRPKQRSRRKSRPKQRSRRKSRPKQRSRRKSRPKTTIPSQITAKTTISSQITAKTTISSQITAKTTISSQITQQKVQAQKVPSQITTQKVQAQKVPSQITTQKVQAQKVPSQITTQVSSNKKIKR